MREKERRLEGRDLLLVGFTLFSMFFGAGNLIFPPNIAAQAGTQTWPAMLGLALSAVGLPVLGVVAVARSGGLDALGSRVHPAFARVFTIVAYLAIGPCLAIPRTATTSFEMAVPPFVGADAPIGVYQLVYSLVFFAAALFIALRPEKLTDRLGKILCPILVALIVVTFVGCLVNPLEGYGPATGDYATHAVVKGFIEGYQTMDTIAALAFGIVIAVNIRARGVEEEGAVVQGTVRAGVVAGGMLLAVYCMLAHIGALSGGALPNPADGAEALTNVVGLLFGTVGSVLLAGIFLIACFNVCVGLISSCGEYFHSICPRLSYRLGPNPGSVRAGAQRHLPGGYRAHRPVLLPAVAGGPPLGVSCGGTVHWSVQRTLCPEGSEGASGLSGRPAPGGRRPGLGAPCRGGRRSGPAALRPKEITSKRRPGRDGACCIQKATGWASGLLDTTNRRRSCVRRRFRVNRRSRRGGRSATSRRRR